MSLIIIAVGFVVRGIYRFFCSAQRFTPHVVRVHNHPRLSFFISFTISLFSFGALMIILVIAARHETNNYALAEDMLRTCTELPAAPLKEHIVILRLDDVQAQTWTPISTRMMRDTVDRGMPIVAGVIPYGISTSLEVQRYFKSYGCNTEVALHGYTHADSQYQGEHEHGSNPEFGALSKHAARKKLDAAFEEMRVLPPHQIVTFIPPENRISEAAAAVLKEYNIRYLSKEGSALYDYRASTWNFDKNHYVPAKMVISDCRKHFESGGKLCVIMLHPQDYANPDGTLNETRYKDYVVLIEMLRKEDVSVATFADLDKIPELKAN
ncbi:MAG TPA: DUF2334 domain-containing protein [Candidatus Paceibacterota bacterium]